MEEAAEFKTKSLLHLSQSIQAYFIVAKRNDTFWKVDTLNQISNSMEFPDGRCKLEWGTAGMNDHTFMT